MGITLVMRGDDHISNTPKQILLYRALGTEPPRFAHVPMIHGMDGKKLSKRHGATAVADYQNEGILPSAMVNFLALMGWSPGGDREVMSLEEMIALFSLDGLQKKAAIFDTKKLEWMNGQHLSRVSAMELEPRLTPALIEAGIATAEMLESRREWYLALIDLLKVRARTVLDMVRQAAPFFPGMLFTIRTRSRSSGRIARPPQSCCTRCRSSSRRSLRGHPNRSKRHCAASRPRAA